MSSRFVSRGTINAESKETIQSSAAADLRPSLPKTEARHNAGWESVEAQLQQERQRRAETKSSTNRDSEKSLYEVLQANKAAKQAAFEESHKLKNEFRHLDEDDVNFLDGLAVSSREEEDRVKKQTQEDLNVFRRAQERQERLTRTGSQLAGSDTNLDISPLGDRDHDLSGLIDDSDLGSTWPVAAGAGGRKRKRRNEKTGMPNLVQRKVFKSDSKGEKGKETEERQIVSCEERDKVSRNSNEGNTSKPTEHTISTAITTTSLPAAVTEGKKMILVDYGSDTGESDDD